MSSGINFSLDWPRSRYEGVLLVPVYVVTGLTLLSLIVNNAIRLLCWDSKWHFIEAIQKVNQKILIYALDGFFGVLDEREEFENATDIEKNLEEIQLQTFTDEADERKAEETIRSTRSSVKINKANILKSKHAINILSVYMHVIILLIFTSFWDVYILESSSECDKLRDCYISDVGEDPIGNCDLINPDNTSVVCYRLQFDMVNAVANIGGTTFVAISGFGLMTHLVLLVQDTFHNHWMRVFLGTVVFVVQYTAFFATVAYYLYFQILSSRLHLAFQISSLVQTVTILIAAFICITNPWALLVWGWNESRNQKVHFQGHIRSHKDSQCNDKDEHAETVTIV